jgi:hypothetical protein
MVFFPGKTIRRRIADKPAFAGIVYGQCRRSCRHPLDQRMQERIHKNKCLIMRDFLMGLRNYKLRQAPDPLLVITTASLLMVSCVDRSPAIVA